MDDANESRWLTFAELSQARGISEASARKLVRRHKWRRQAGNQGIVRILVPTEALDRPRDDPRTDIPHTPPHDPRTDPSDIPRAISALDGAISALREQLEQANSRAELAEQGRDRAEQAIAAERANVDALRDRLNEMQAQLADAHAARQAAEAADARAEQAEQGREAERTRADTLQERLREMLTQLATAIADAKAAHGRAWSTGEHLAAIERQAAAERERADRAASGAAHERQDFIDAESRTRREMDVLRGRLDAIQTQLAARQEVVEAAEAIRKADDARLARGRWARLLAAWRGE